MSEGRLRADWARTVALARMTGLAMNGKEPPLGALIPARFRPTFVAPKAAAVDPETNRAMIAGYINAAKGRV